MTRNHKPVFIVLLLAGVVLAGTSALVRLGASDQGTQPTKQTARRAYDLLAEGFGAGFNGPIPIVVDVNGDEQAPQRVYDGVRNLDGVASAGEPQFNDQKTVALVFVTPDSAPQDERTEKLVERLRSDVVPAATEGGDAAVYVSGLNAAFIDIGNRIMERLPLFLLYIIGVTFIVLAMAFRSIVISLTAAVTTILSAFIGFGVLTLVFQEGHLLDVVGLDKTGPIETFVPPIAFAILFGLSMDYMVFLMSRIREEHVHGLATREAVEHGIAAIGRVVVAAALIMGTVFAAFILTADRISKEFGLLLAVAILTDALIVRMTLVPSFLTGWARSPGTSPAGSTALLPNITIESPHDREEPAPARGGAARGGLRSETLRAPRWRSRRAGSDEVNRPITPTACAQSPSSRVRRMSPVARPPTPRSAGAAATPPRPGAARRQSAAAAARRIGPPGRARRGGRARARGSARPSTMLDERRHEDQTRSRPPPRSSAPAGSPGCCAKAQPAMIAADRERPPCSAPLEAAAPDERQGRRRPATDRDEHAREPAPLVRPSQIAGVVASTNSPPSAIAPATTPDRAPARGTPATSSSSPEPTRVGGQVHRGQVRGRGDGERADQDRGRVQPARRRYRPAALPTGTRPEAMPPTAAPRANGVRIDETPSTSRRRAARARDAVPDRSA